MNNPAAFVWVTIAHLVLLCYVVFIIRKSTLSVPGKVRDFVFVGIWGFVIASQLVLWSVSSITHLCLFDVVFMFGWILRESHMHRKMDRYVKSDIIRQMLQPDMCGQMICVRDSRKEIVFASSAYNRNWLDSSKEDYLYAIQQDQFTKYIDYLSAEQRSITVPMLIKVDGEDTSVRIQVFQSTLTKEIFYVTKVIPAGRATCCARQECHEKVGNI